MRVKSLLLSLILCCFAIPSSHALTVTLTNLTNTTISNFIFLNGVSFGPLSPQQTVTLPANLNAQLANQVGNLLVVSGYGTQSCGQVYYFDSVTIINIQALAYNYINCLVTYA